MSGRAAFHSLALACALALLFAHPAAAAPSTLSMGEAHVWEPQEITFRAGREYANPYVDVVCWIDLTRPGHTGRVYGFWDGGRVFRVRFVATAAGEWRWRSGPNQPSDSGFVPT